MASARIAAFRHSQEIVPLLSQLVAPGDVVLVKGSRALGLESVARELKEHLGRLPQTIPLRRTVQETRRCA